MDVLRGKVWKFGDRISTDLMMPGSLVLARPGITDEEAAQYCMSANRPGWAQQVKRCDIIVAGQNFGCGSSRNAAGVLKTLGISAVLAESTSRIFLRNAINSGLPVMWCKGISEAVEEGDELEVDMASGRIRNLSKATEIRGDAWPEDSPPMQILRAGGFHEFLKGEMAKRAANRQEI